ncbi:hypothetical protein P8452_41636 [Trifolium repens]|nr:hypothetical protein P8452_41636 [Trifolium repens]
MEREKTSERERSRRMDLRETKKKERTKTGSRQDYHEQFNQHGHKQDNYMLRQQFTRRCWPERSGEDV